MVVTEIFQLEMICQASVIKVRPLHPINIQVIWAISCSQTGSQQEVTFLPI